MAAFFAELLGVTIPFIASLSIMLFPMWKTRNVKTKTIIVFLLCFTICVVTGFTVMRQFGTIDFNSPAPHDLFMVFMSIFSDLISFLVFRKRLGQNLFLVAVTFMYSPVSVGIGRYVAQTLFNVSPFTVVGISIIVTAVTLPPLLIMLRRLCSNSDMKQAVVFWRLAWLVPTGFFFIVWFSSNYYSGNVDNSFIVVRILAYLSLLVICYLFEIAVRQISEAEAAKREAKELAAQTDFYRKMSHSLRTPLTIVSTNVQTAMRRPQESAELLTKSHAEIMKMADAISEALKDGEKGAGES